MKTYSNLTKLILLFTIHLVVFSLIAWLAPMRWETNDDIGMAMIASGAFNGIPDCHLVFINGILGWLFAKLYTWFSTLEWYTMFQCAVHIFSATAIVWYILSKDVSKWMKALWCIFFYAFWLKCIVSIQFTTSAGLAAVAGCLILYSAAFSFMSKNPKLCTNGLFVVGGGYLLISSLLRFNVTGLVVFLFIPLFIYIIKMNWKAYIPFIIIATIIVGCKLSDDLFYKKQEWNYYKEYNKERSKLQDGQNQRFLNNLPDNITQDDYNLMCWFLGDVNKISLSVLKELNSRAAKASSPIEKIKISLVQVCKRNIYLIFPLYAILLCIPIFGYKQKNRFFLFGYVVLVFLLMLLIGYVAHFKYRVFACVLLTEMMVAYTFLHKETNKTLGWVIAICSIAMSGNLLYQTIYSVHKHHLNSNRLQEQLSFIEAVPLNSYIVDIQGICYEQINPFNMKSLHFPSYYFGWFANFPLNDRAYSFLDFIKSDCFIFIDTTSPYNPHYALQLIQKSIETNYNCRTNTTLYLEKNNLQLYQLVQL